MALLPAIALLALPVESDIWREAGYRHGAALPQPTPAVSVAAFGALPDDDLDDTAAFEAALLRGGVLSLSAGEYIIDRRLFVRKPGTVLLGAGSTRTFLRFTRSLEAIDPRPTENSGGTPTTEWSWSGGLLCFKGSGPGGPSAALLPARRGARVVHLASPLPLKVGQEVVLSLRSDGTQRLALHLYEGDAGDSSNLVSPGSVSLSNRVAAVFGTEVHLASPLPVGFPAEFSPSLAVARLPDEFGIRGVGFRLTDAPYRGHFREDGWNALQFDGVRHAWAEDILLDGVDSGIFVTGAHVTLRRISFLAGRPLSDEGFAGHHGISLSGQSHRLESFLFDTRFHHDITFSAWSNGNVVRDGRGVELSLDFHKRGPFANLVTNLSTVDAASYFRIGGGDGLGRGAGAWNAFWNLRSDGPIDWPWSSFAPGGSTAFVGVDFAGPPSAGYVSTPLLPGDPADLWLASRAEPRRLTWHLFNRAPVASAAGTTGLVGRSPLAVALRGNGSTDPDGRVVSHRWELSDGRVLDGAAADVAFAAPGSYLATLVVTDDAGATDACSVPIRVLARPGAQGTLRLGSSAVRWVPVSRTAVRGEAVYRVLDAGGRPLPGALVTAELSGLEQGVVTALADRSGAAVLRTSALPAATRGTVTFAVRDVSLAGHAYLPALNRVGEAVLRR